MTKTHEMKTWPTYFEAVADGSKTFEVRRDDRGFAVGDVLMLREWDPATQEYTGRTEIRRVSYVLRGYEALALGFVVMGLAIDAPQTNSVDRRSRALAAEPGGGEVSARERCPVCDRPEATAEQWARVERDENIPAAEGIAVCWGEGEPQCVMARVDWRARALAAGAERDEANAARDTLRERVAEEIRLRLDGHGDDDLAAEAGEVRRERDEARALIVAINSGDARLCEECGIALATQYDDHGNPVCDAHAGGIVCRRDLPHAAAIRVATGGEK